MTADLRAYAREAARRNGLDEDTFVRQIQQESGFDPDAFNAGSGATGIAQIVARFHPDVDPHDPIASLDYAARWMADLHRRFGSWKAALMAYNWGTQSVLDWYAAGGQDAEIPAETRRYLDVILGPGWPEPYLGSNTPDGHIPESQTLRVTDDGVRLRAAPSTSAAVLATLPAGTLVAPTSDHAWRPVRWGTVAGFIADELLTSVQAEIPENGNPENRRYTFDPTTPTELQRQDWTCSIRSTMWMLKSIGIAVTPDEAQDAMSPHYVTPAVGLLDASGAGIVEVLGDRWGVEADSYRYASFDGVAAMAGQMPVAIGLPNWGGPGAGHWSAVRGFDGERLVLANPGGTGPRFGQQTLTRAEFDARGPASAVFIPLEGT